MLFFSGGEIIETAIQIERNGFAFYQSLAEKEKQEDIKALFTYLASEEEKHIENFQSLYDSFKEYKLDMADKEEYSDYIRMLADLNVFTKKDGADVVLGKIQGKGDALDAALHFEKESIVFFAEIRNMVRGTQKDAVDELIRQEQGHLKRLMLMKKDITG